MSNKNDIGFFLVGTEMHLIKVLEPGKVQILADMGEATPEKLAEHFNALTHMRKDLLTKRVKH